jgi:hypothetical protein
MKVDELINALGAEVKTSFDVDKEISGCYVSDLLSDVLANSMEGNLWITHHTHPNVVAVAAVKELSLVVVTGDKPIEPATLSRAEAEKVNIVTSGLPTFETAGKVYDLLRQK